MLDLVDLCQVYQLVSRDQESNSGRAKAPLQLEECRCRDSAASCRVLEVEPGGRRRRARHRARRDALVSGARVVDFVVDFAKEKAALRRATLEGRASGWWQRTQWILK